MTVPTKSLIDLMRESFAATEAKLAALAAELRERIRHQEAA